MPDALELLKTRRSLPSALLGEPGPTRSQLAEMLGIAVHVPDHGKLTPWRFIVFARGDARRAVPATPSRRSTAPRRSRRAGRQGRRTERKRLAHAPLTVVVVSTAAPHVKIPEWEQVLSAGNAALSLVFAAHAMGYAAHWTSGFVAADADARRAIGLSDAERIVAVIEIGTPAGAGGRAAAPGSCRRRHPLDAGGRLSA